jgi:hypothetical protein
MARVEIPAPGDLIMDAAGNVRANVTVSLKLAGTATDVTHYSALTGGTSTTGGLKSGSDGTIVDGSGNRRYVDSGLAMDLLIDGRTRQIEPMSAADVTSYRNNGALNAKYNYGAIGDGSSHPLSGSFSTLAAAQVMYPHATSLSDETDWAALQGLTNDSGSSKRPGYIPPSTAAGYRLGKPVVLVSGAKLYGAGKENTVLDASVVAASANGHYYGIQGLGTVGTKTLTTLDVHKGEMQTDVASVSGLAAGDWVMLATDGPRGTLHTTINASDTSIVVDLTTGTGSFSTKGYLAIGSEQIGYSGVAVVGSQATFTIRAGTLGRGAQGTTAAAHTAGVSCFEFSSGKYILWRPNCFDRGEIKRIESISGSTIYFEQAINDDYTIANAASVRKVTPVQDFEIRDLTIKHRTNITSAPAHVEWGIGLEWCDNFTIQNCGVHYAQHINIGMNNCTRFKILNNTIYGKASSSIADANALYGIAGYNSCQWGTVSGNHVEKAFKLWTSSCNTAGQNWWGQPRDITVVGNTLDNAGLGFYSRHPGIELHGAGERMNVIGNTCSGVDSVISIQTVKDCNVSQNVGSGWYRAGIIFSGAHELAGVTIENNDVGSRTYGTGRTTLASNIDAVVTTVPAASTASFLVDTTAVTYQAIKIDSEIIRYSSADGTNFLTCVRGYAGTTAATHTSGAVITPLGSAFACPIDMDLTDCVWGQRAYNQPVTDLTVDPGAAGTTLTVTDTTGFPAATATTPQLAVIEGANSARNFEPEVVSYTGLTGTTLTGVVRGAEYTSAVAHAIGCFVMPYEIPVSQIKIANNQGVQDFDYYGLNVTGYTPSRQFRIEGNQLLYNGSARPTTSGFRVDVHSAKMRNNEIYGWPLGYWAVGNGQLWRGNECEMTAQESTTTGYGLKITGFDCKVFENIFSRTYQAVSVAATLLRSVIARNVFDVPASSRGITGSYDTTTTARDNTFILPTGTDLANVAAGPMTMNCPGNFYWRVAGATGITAITVQTVGTEITLKFDGAPTVTNGATLKLAGAANFVATADDVLTLVSDGTAWREKARAVN